MRDRNAWEIKTVITLAKMMNSYMVAIEDSDKGFEEFVRKECYGMFII